MRIVFAVLLFAVQVLGYGLNRTFLLLNPEVVKRLPGLTWMVDTFAIRHAETVAFMLYFLLHGLVAVFIVKLVYRDPLLVRLGALLTAGTILAYVGTNAIGRVANLARMQSVSMEIATYASSPLLTILLISALTLAKPPLAITRSEGRAGQHQ